MTEPALDLRTSAAVVRRGWALILVFALIGLCGGIAFGLHGSRQHSADALVVIPTQAITTANANPVDMLTQTLIATSTAVLAPAAAEASPPVPVNELAVSVTAPSTSILRVRVQAKRSQQAVLLANAVANGYISYVTKAHLFEGQQPILLQPATPTTPASTTSRVATKGVMGLVAGLVVGTIVVIVRSRRDRRLRRREDIADAVGLPVLATLEAGQYTSTTDWTRFLERFEPSDAALWNLRRLLHSLMDDHYDSTLTIRIVSFADDGPALAAGPQLAMAAAELGIPAQIDPGMHAVLAPLRAACAQLKRAGFVQRPSGADDHEDDPWRRMWELRNRATANREVVISILALERTNPEWSPFPGRSILSISAGIAGADELARLALAATEGGGELEGVLLMNPESGDAGAGALPDHKDYNGGPRGVVDYPGDAARVAGHQR